MKPIKMYTIDDILALQPSDIYDEDRLVKLWAGREAISLREILELTIPIDDRDWVIPRLVPNSVVTVKWAHLRAHEAKKHAASAAATADKSAASAANAEYAWDETRDKELYRLLTILCDMTEE